MEYEINQEKVQTAKRIISYMETQYNSFTSSGCSVHEFNRLKSNAKSSLSRYLKGEGKHFLNITIKNINDLTSWFNKRKDIANTNKCTNYGIERNGEGRKLFCMDCEFNKTS